MKRRRRTLAHATTTLVADDGLVVDFLNIPEGVTVTVPNMIALPDVPVNADVDSAEQVYGGHNVRTRRW